jgi:hypothetical protein
MLPPYGRSLSILKVEEAHLHVVARPHGLTCQKTVLLIAKEV